MATKQQHVAALLPLDSYSKFFFEVLRLGLEGTNPRISIKALVAIRINVTCGVTLLELGEWCMADKNGNVRTRQVRHTLLDE